MVVPMRRTVAIPSRPRHPGEAGPHDPLRATLAPMRDDQLDRRLAAAADHLASLRPALEGGGPWPLATRFDHAPEASWGPREVLAHLAEMLSYWLGEIERIVESGEAPAAFGRAATDDVRLAIIGRDRSLPIRALSERVQAGIERWRARWAELDDASRARLGVHPTLGAVTVAAVAERFVAGHLEGHLDQLAEAMGGGSPAR